MVEKITQNNLLEKLLEEPAKKSPFDFGEFFSKNPLPAGIAIFGMGLIVFGIVISLRNFSFGTNQVEIIEVDEEQEFGGKTIAHLSGAVEKPGVYELKSDARLNDLISMAGGLSDKADRNWFNKNINLAQRVSDGVKIYIPYEGEASNVPKVSKVSNGGSVFGVSSSQGKININTATQAKLESLPKIGPVTAKKIIDYRESHGNFAKVEDLAKVSGISSKTVETIKEMITVF